MDRCVEVFLTHIQSKYEVIKRVCQNYQEQKLVLSEKNIDTERMDVLLEEMDTFADQLEELEVEFQKIYPEVAAYISANGTEAIPNLEKLQSTNKEIEEMFELSQDLEVENHQKIVQYFQQQKNGIKQGRTGSRVAYGYYQNMSGAGASGNSTWESRQ